MPIKVGNGNILNVVDSVLAIRALNIKEVESSIVLKICL
jgi:uncharacterized Zn ribbon protein